MVVAPRGTVERCLPVLPAALGVDPAAARAALQAWGPGRDDARFNEGGESDPALIPPAYGLRDVAVETCTGEEPSADLDQYLRSL